jgi:hypothetical protein
MQAVDIVNRLKEVLPNYTDEFSDIISVSSLTRSGTTITASASSAHGLLTGDYVTIRGATNPITISSIVRNDDIVTVTTATDHKLSDPSLYSDEEAKRITFEISGAVPTDYNGTIVLYDMTVPDSTTFTYKIDTTPTTPATTPGFLLQEDFDGYNGYKEVTVLNTTSFTYETANTDLNTPSQGTIEMSSATRIAWGATPERVSQFYSEDDDRVSQNWMFLVLGPKIIYKDDTVASDLSTAKSTNESYFYQSQQDFSIFTFIPSQGETLAGMASDKSRIFEKAILRSIANFPFESPLVESLYQSTVYVGNDAEDYNTAWYAHRFDFLAKGYVQNPDTASFNPGVPLELVDGIIQDKDMTYKHSFR